jgi:hypothetical protein
MTISDKERKIIEAIDFLKKKGYTIIQDKDKWLKIPELGIEVEIEVHDKEKSWDELKLSEKENELLTVEQCIFLANSKYAKKLKMDGNSSKDDFFIQQPFKINRKNKDVARFDANSDRADLDCYWDPSVTNDALGVRFVRKIK